MFTKTQTFLKIFGARGKKCHFRTFSLIFPFIGAFARKNVSVWGERHPPRAGVQGAQLPPIAFQGA